MTEKSGGLGAPDPAGLVEVRDNPALARFELTTGGRVIGVASYALVGGASSDGDPAAGAHSAARPRIVFFHTQVLPEFEGQGLAAQLAAYALDAAVASGRDVVALCPYIKEYVRRHPEPLAARLVAATQADVSAARHASAAAG